MASLYEELLRSVAEDGASMPCAPAPGRPADAVEDLMDAWLEERHYSIEYRMLVERACQLLARILNDGELTPQSSRKARALIRVLRAVDVAERSN
jgi:hypothetical protein